MLSRIHSSVLDNRELYAAGVLISALFIGAVTIGLAMRGAL